MLTLKEKMDVNLTHSNPAGTWHGTGLTKLRGSNGLTWERVFISINDLSDLTRIDFYKLPRDVTSAYVQEYVDNQGQYSNYHLDWTNRDNITTSNCLTPESQSNSLITLANQFKDIYFGGVTQTAATLFSYLENMYGDANGFFYVRTAGGNLYATQRIGTVDTCVTEYGSAPNSVLTWYPSNVITWGNEYVLPSDVDSADAIAAALIFGPEISPQKLIFDVYVDGVIGQKGPQTIVKWHDYNDSDSSIIAHELVKVKIWGFGYMQNMTDPTVYVHAEEGINVPNPASVRYSGEFSFDDSQSAYVYVSSANSWYSDYSALDKITYFGIDGVPDHLGFFLRFDYTTDNGDTWGDLYCVNIPYEYEGAAYVTVTRISGSDNNKLYDTIVNVIGGLPPSDPELDPDEPPAGEDPEGDPSSDGPYAPDGYEDLSDGEPSGFDGDAVLTTTYSMPKLTMQSVGADLWSQTYYNVLKVQNNPIENVIACKWYPMSITGTPNTPIKIGDVTLGVSADKIGTMYTKSFGSYKHVTTTGRPGYLSMTPYCVVKLHLPYVGVVQLDATEIYKRTLSGKYVVDLITGDVLVILYLDGNPYMTLTGKMGVDIPLTSTNRVQTELAAASRTLSAVIGGAGHILAADAGGAVGAAASGIMSIMGMDYSSQRCTSHSPACCTYENLWIFVEVQYNPTKVSAGYKAQRGLPAHLYQTLQYMKNQGGGFVQIDGRTTINVAMTDEENRMLEQIMTSGFYL